MFEGVRDYKKSGNHCDRLRGVITGVSISMSTDDIEENVKGGRVIEAKRLISRKEGQIIESLLVMLRSEKVR